MSAGHAGKALQTAIVGCGGMARWHARAMAALDEYELVACCDLEESAARKFAEDFGLERSYTDYAAMLAAVRPDVVTIVTPNNLHAEMTIQAAEAGARGVYCEKPMATCMADGQAMVAACRDRGAALAVNHQRRMSPPVLKMRELIVAGAIGDVSLFRGSCAGDLLSDATHLVDTIRFLAGDAPVRWVFGQVHRTPGDAVPRRPGGVQLASRGFRYGHPVETGAFGVCEFETGARIEVLCGDLRLPGREYGDYEVLGTRGRLWRAGDVADPPVLMQDDGAAGWRPAPPDEADDHGATGRACYRQFAAMVRDGAEHPLSGDSALQDLEVIMAIYESARLRAKVELPLTQPGVRGGPRPPRVAAGGGGPPPPPAPPPPPPRLHLTVKPVPAPSCRRRNRHLWQTSARGEAL
jgi:predicted dehydrogenase